MENLLLLVCCLGLGILFRQSRLLPENAHLSLNGFVIYAALPALVLEKIPAIPFSGNVLYPVLMPWLIFGLSIPFFAWLGKHKGWHRETIGCLTLTAGLGNTSFVGIPVMQMLWGEPGVQVAILADQPGSFAALATLGIGVASYYASGTSTFKDVLLRVVRFPPFLAFVLALILKGGDWRLPEITHFSLSLLGSMVVPLALVSVGMQLKASTPGKELGKLAWGLGFKLILAPALIFTLYILVLENKSLLSQGSVMEAAMGPMITAAIVATNFGLNPSLVGRVVGLGIPASFLTLPLWYLLLQYAL